MDKIGRSFISRKQIEKRFKGIDNGGIPQDQYKAFELFIEIHHNDDGEALGGVTWIRIPDQE